MKRRHNLELQRKIVTPDGTGLFVRVIQQPSAAGNIPIILNDGLGCSGFIWKYFIEYFQHQHPIIHWNYRGHGYSDTPENLDTINIPQLAEDSHFILDQLNIEQAILCGHSMGVQVVLESFQQNGSRFAGLILLCGSFEYPLQSWQASQQKNASPTILNRAMKKLIKPLYENAQRYSGFWQPLWSTLLNTDIPYRMALLSAEVNKSLIKKEDFSPYFEHLSCMQANVFMQTMKAYSEHSAKKVLPEIDKPTLIVCGGRDTFSPHWVSLDMHHAVESSELLYIPDGTHCSPIEHPELLHLRVEKFLWPHLTQASNNLCSNTTDTSMRELALKRLRRTANS